MVKEGIWDKAVDAVKPVDVKIAGTLGGQEAASNMAQAAEDLRHGHIIDELGHALVVDADIVKRAYNDPHGFINGVDALNVEAAGTLGGPKAAADMVQAVADYNQGHYIDEFGHGLEVDGDIIASATKKVEAFFGAPSNTTRHHQPSPHHPAETPIVAQANTKGPSKA